MQEEDLIAQVAAWQDALLESEEALDFLYGRGLVMDTINHFRLGYVPDGKYAGTISIPYLLPEVRGGVPYSVRFRFIREHKPKYLNGTGIRASLFNLNDLDKPDVYVTEGEFDAMILHQTGRAAVGVPGTQAFRDYYRWLFVGPVTIFYDGDEPGRKASRLVYRHISSVVQKVFIIDTPDGEDANSLFLKGELESVLGTGIPYLDDEEEE